MMKLPLRKVLAGMAILMSALTMTALDLPVKRVNGVDLYYYAVRRGDTVFSIARKLGVTRDDIVRHNPSAADGVRQGMTLFLPVSKFADVSPRTETKDAERQRPAKSFRYKVNKGETLFGLSHRFGVTPDEIIALNPGANDGIKAGEYLTIPGAEPATAEVADNKPETTVSDPQPAPSAEEEVVAVPGLPEPDRSLRPVRPGIVEVSASEVSVEVPCSRIAVMLPLMLNEENPPKHAQLCTDFVRGMLLAAKEAGRAQGDIEIDVYDTRGDIGEIQRLLADSAMAAVDVIVAPENENSLITVENFAAHNDIYVFNILAVQDTAYLTNPMVMQANIPHKMMYEKAVAALMEIYDGYTPVFLISKGGRSEKIAFTQFARDQYESRGVTPMEIAFDGMLTQRDLEVLDPAGRYVFIPCSGSLSEFNKFARPLQYARDNAADPSSIALFGYPDWTTFRNEAADMLHSLEAVFYSRFYSDPTQDETTRFNQTFNARFGTDPMQVVPSQAMLGYDTAMYLITNLRSNEGIIDPAIPAEYVGIQSAFKFESNGEPEENTPSENAGESGPVNTALYLINLLQGNGVATRIL